MLSANAIDDNSSNEENEQICPLPIYTGNYPIASKERLKSKLDSGNHSKQTNIRELILALWKYRQDKEFTLQLCENLSTLTLTKQSLDEVEFYLPQLAHMVVHLDKELPIDAIEQFVFLFSQSSVHFALQFFWMIYAALDEHRPKRNGNPRTFARCAQLLLALEQCFVYGSPVAHAASELLTQNSISREEMDKIIVADRRFFAAQNSIECLDKPSYEGWLHKKGGGTRTCGRRNWKLRWCRIEKRMLLVYNKPGDCFPRTAVPLDRAEVIEHDNSKHEFYFELIHEFSETKVKFAARTESEKAAWIDNLRLAASAPHAPGGMSPGKVNPAHTLARMSWAMRKFILQSSGSNERPDTPDGVISPNKVASGFQDIPANKSGTLQRTSSWTSCITAYDDELNKNEVTACKHTNSPSKNIVRRRSLQTRLKFDSLEEHIRSIYGDKGCAASIAVTSSTTNETEEIKASLETHQQRRYEFFSGMINFVKSITDVSESLRRIDSTKRKSALQSLLDTIKLPPHVYIPLCRSTETYCRVVSVLTKEGRVFSTNERAPCMLYFVAEVDKFSESVSDALFRHLHYTPNDASLSGSNHQNASIGDNGRLIGTETSNTQFETQFLESLLSSPERIHKLEQLFGELSYSTLTRLKSCVGNRSSNDCQIKTLIAKSYDDLRQEVLVMQLISYFKQIFQSEGLPLWLRPYQILSTGAGTGLIEVVRDAISLDGIKKSVNFTNLRSHFEYIYGESIELLEQAERNFVHSLAAYSIVCYILCIKDRHNGNILLDIEGHIVHIDFGFCRAPGGSFSFETAPFKLTSEMVDVLGGRNSSNFEYFTSLCVKGALAAKKHAETIYTLVEIMSHHSRLPCFNGSPSTSLSHLRDRLFLNMPEEKIEPTIISMIDKSYDHFGTTKYDQFQVYSNGIAK